jgi:hypothetical protein
VCRAVPCWWMGNEKTPSYIEKLHSGRVDLQGFRLSWGEHVQMNAYKKQNFSARESENSYCPRIWLPSGVTRDEDACTPRSQGQTMDGPRIQVKSLTHRLQNNHVRRFTVHKTSILYQPTQLFVGVWVVDSLNLMSVEVRWCWSPSVVLVVALMLSINRQMEGVMLRTPVRIESC